MLTKLEKYLLFYITCVASIIGLSAWQYPSTWDAMTYHLPRVMHWLQNGSLEHYPTNILRQLSYSPLAEYLTTLIFLITKTDHFLNFTQFFAMLGSWYGVYRVAILLEAEMPILAVFLCATIPMGILQGSSTQTDYVASVFLIWFVYHLMKGHAFRTGLLLGLALLTKAYCYLFTLPFLFMFKPKRVWLILGLALLINLPYYLQSLDTFGSLFGYTADVQFGNPITNLFGNFKSSLYPSLNEDTSGNPQFFILILISLLIWWWDNRRHKNLNKYIYSLLLCILLFVLCVKWNKYVVRFHLPLILLFCPLVTIIFENYKKLTLIVTALLVLSLPYLFLAKPLITKNKQEIYFLKRPALYSKYKNIVVKIKESNCKEIGIIAGEDSWEYSLWAMLDYGKGYRLEHIDITNISNKLKYPLGQFKPCFKVDIT